MVYESLLQEVMEKTGERRKFFDFPYNIKKRHLTTQHMPIPFNLFGEVTLKLNKLLIGEKTEIAGYLENVQLKNLDQRARKLIIDLNLNAKNGFRTYSLYAESSRIPLETFVISPIELSPNIGLPNRLELMKLGKMTSGENIFFLSDFSPETLIFPKIESDIPVLSLRDMQRSIIEISSLSRINNHVLDSILSPYIGSDVYKTDGIGSSYIRNQEMMSDLERINNIINNDAIGVPLNHFGILNYLQGNAKQINNGRLNLGSKLKTISWNLQSGTDYENMKQSDFKYYFKGGINVYAHRDLINNFDFQHSLLRYNFMRKEIDSILYGKAIIAASKEIEKQIGGGFRNMIFDIIDEKDLNIQIGRIISYYSVFTKDPEEINKHTEDAIIRNIEDIVENVHVEKPTTKGSQSLEKRLDPKVRIAFYSSNRTRDGFIENYMKRKGCNEKKAENVFNEILNKGLIYSGDNIHFKWHNEDSLRLT